MKLLTTISLILLATLCNAQSPFKVGPYAKGTKVYGVKNVVYIAKVAMKKATVMPSKENTYWGLYSKIPLLTLENAQVLLTSQQAQLDSLKAAIKELTRPMKIEEVRWNETTNIMTLILKKQ